MNLNETIDFADRVHNEIGRYRVEFTLSPQRLTTTDYIVSSLTWYSINYGSEEIDHVPNDKRGIYAFAIFHPSDVLPIHGYILYIGIAGKNSNRSLRERYRDYLTDSKIRSRAQIRRMIGDWHQVLKFLYAPVEDDVSSDELIRIETQFNTALMPPFSINDLDAELREQRRAFP